MVVVVVAVSCLFGLLVWVRLIVLWLYELLFAVDLRMLVCVWLCVEERYRCCELLQFALLMPGGGVLCCSGDLNLFGRGWMVDFVWALVIVWLGCCCLGWCCGGS